MKNISLSFLMMFIPGLALAVFTTPYPFTRINLVAIDNVMKGQYKTNVDFKNNFMETLVPQEKRDVYRDVTIFDIYDACLETPQINDTVVDCKELVRQIADEHNSLIDQKRENQIVGMPNGSRILSRDKQYYMTTVDYGIYGDIVKEFGFERAVFRTTDNKLMCFLDCVSDNPTYGQVPCYNAEEPFVAFACSEKLTKKRWEDGMRHSVVETGKFSVGHRTDINDDTFIFDDNNTHSISKLVELQDQLRQYNWTLETSKISQSAANTVDCEHFEPRKAQTYNYISTNSVLYSLYRDTIEDYNERLGKDTCNKSFSSLINIENREKLFASINTNAQKLVLGVTNDQPGINDTNKLQFAVNEIRNMLYMSDPKIIYSDGNPEDELFKPIVPEEDCTIDEREIPVNDYDSGSHMFAVAQVVEPQPKRTRHRTAIECKISDVTDNVHFTARYNFIE